MLWSSSADAVELIPDRQFPCQWLRPWPNVHFKDSGHVRDTAVPYPSCPWIWDNLQHQCCILQHQ